MWGGSDGVDHVAREVLQHGVANRGSRAEPPRTLLGRFSLSDSAPSPLRSKLPTYRHTGLVLLRPRLPPLHPPSTIVFLLPLRPVESLAPCLEGHILPPKLPTKRLLYPLAINSFSLNFSDHSLHPFKKI